ncbi:MAG: hypothetical protein KQA34_03075 [Candidatus Aenigmarchaeota archaeon]|nr:hypothetical protein [Candidatus Aenigmarchaeota archaeon]
MVKVAGYLSISKSEKSFVLKIENKKFFVNKFDFVKLLSGKNTWIPIFEINGKSNNGNIRI